MNLAGLAKRAALTALFFGLWVICALGFNILLLMFFGVVAMPMAGFGLIQSPPPATFVEMSGATFAVYVATSIVAVAVGGYFSAITIIHRGNGKVLDERVKYIGYAVAWMAHTWFYALGLLFLVMLAFGFATGSLQPGSTTDVHTTMHAARYFLLVAVVAAGVFAWIKLSEKQT